MAKKKSIGNLISGIVDGSSVIAAKRGDTEASKTVENLADIPENAGTSGADISEVSEELREALETKRKSKVGRPRKNTERRSIVEEGCKIDETRATFIVQKEQIRKIKYISLATTSLLKDVIAHALGEYIASWEEEHGEIKI